MLIVGQLACCCLTVLLLLLLYYHDVPGYICMLLFDCTAIVAVLPWCSRLHMHAAVWLYSYYCCCITMMFQATYACCCLTVLLLLLLYYHDVPGYICMLLFDCTASIVAVLPWCSRLHMYAAVWLYCYYCWCITMMFQATYACWVQYLRGQWLTVIELLHFHYFHFILLCWNFSPLWNMWTGSGAHLPPIQRMPRFFPVDKGSRV
jgi:riboflavin transporter FmnP